MLISSRGKYGLRVIIDLAEHENGGYIPMKEVAKRQDISLKYLEQILPTFVKNGLIEGVHGKGGGYRLTRKPEEYTLGEILRLTEGDLAPVTCVENGGEACERKGACPAMPVWQGLDALINEYLDGKTVRDLMCEE